MPDLVPVPPAAPVVVQDTGSHSSSFKLTVIASTVGVVIMGLSAVFQELATLYPGTAWIGMIAGALASISSVVAYILGRSKVKVMEMAVNGAASIAASQGTAAGLRALGIPSAPATPMIAPPGSLGGNP